MGLLRKATKNSSPVQVSSPPASSTGVRQDRDPLGEMEKALCSRLLSLQADSIRPETAISLLKAYGSFQAGLCLSLRKGSYSTYASVGTGAATKFVFSQDALNQIPGKNYYTVNHELSGEFPPSLQLWAFPLTPAETGFPLAILAVATDQKAFQCEAIEAVIRKTREVFLPPPGFTGNIPTSDVAGKTTVGKTAAAKTETPKAGGLLNRISRKTILEKNVMESLDSRQGTSQGFIIEALQYSSGGFSGRIFSMVSGFGTAQPLTPGRCLVLFDSAQDGDLIARHLAKTVSGKSIFCFRAENPQEALSLLKPYL